MKKLIKNLNYLWNKFKKNNIQFWDDLEEQLILNDVSAGTAKRILDKVKDYVYRENINDIEIIKDLLKKQIMEILDGKNKAMLSTSKTPPSVFLIVGINGVGKTSAIAKMAKLFCNSGEKILVAAADTYRAAAMEQIKHYTDKLGLELVCHQRFSDPGAVVYDSIRKAVTKKFDKVIIDTAGRMQTSHNLMEELKKIKRVVNKNLNRDPDEILMVIDSTTGQNAKFQAETFNKALGLTGIILTKTDGTSKGGIVLTIKNDLGIPIKMITNGEKLDDIHYFDSKKFAEKMLF
jgi:fused signal recognition particle receptor